MKLNLKQQNSSYDKLIKSLSYEIILKKVKNREISSKLNISDYEIKKHKEKMAKIKPDIYDLSHILVKFSSEPTAEEKKEKRKLGEEIFNKLKTEDFGKVAYEFSDSPDANEGGALGKLKQSELPEIFIEKINCDNNAVAPIIGPAGGMGIGALAGGWKGAAIGGPIGLLGGFAFNSMKKGNKENNKKQKKQKKNK